MKHKYRVDVYQSFDRHGNQERPVVKKLAKQYDLEFDGGGMVLNTDQYGLIYYGTKQSVLLFADELRDKGINTATYFDN